MEKRIEDVVVVGAGVAGLSAALFAARSGRRVVVVEKAQSAGGLARSQIKEGFTFNAGPRAIYSAGFAARALEQLGVPISGRPVALRGIYYRASGAVHCFPVNLSTALRSGLNISEAVEFARAYRRMSSGPLPGSDRSAAAWIAEQAGHGRVRALLAGLVRLSTYGDERKIDALTAARQLQLAAQGGVLYVDGGWQSIVDGLLAATRAAGVVVRTGCAVTGLYRREAANMANMANTGLAPGVWQVEPAGGESLLAHNVILAVESSVAARLAGSKELQDFCDARDPSLAGCLDVALESLPVPGRNLLIDCDRRAYLSVHSAYARLAPRGGALIHCLRYAVDPGEDSGLVRLGLEEMLDEFQPAWRDRLVHARFLPHMKVTPALPEPRRPRFADVRVPGSPGLFVSGDWVDSESLLLDGALAAAQRCVRAIVEGRQAA